MQYFNFLKIYLSNLSGLLYLEGLFSPQCNLFCKEGSVRGKNEILRINSYHSLRNYDGQIQSLSEKFNLLFEVTVCNAATHSYICNV